MPTFWLYCVCLPLYLSMCIYLYIHIYIYVCVLGRAYIHELPSMTPVNQQAMVLRKEFPKGLHVHPCLRNLDISQSKEAHVRATVQAPHIKPVEMPSKKYPT